MSSPCAVEISPALSRLRVHLFAFADARGGFGHAGLDPLRARVLGRAREELAGIRDLLAAPRIAGVVEVLEALGAAPRRHPPLIVRELKARLRGDPFPVESNALDTARLVGIYERCTTWILKPPPPGKAFRFEVGSPPLRDPEGPEDASATPVLRLEGRSVASLQHRVDHFRPGERDAEFVLVMIEGLSEDLIDPEALSRRLANWFENLCGARLVEAVSSAPETER